MTEEELQKIRKWVELNESAWQEFVAASSKSYCYREYGYDPNAKDEDKSLFNVLLPHLRPIRGLARLGIWRARIHTDANQPHQAIEDCLQLLAPAATGRERKPLSSRWLELLSAIWPMRRY